MQVWLWTSLGLAALAAAWDFRTGTIPNWLTIPLLAAAPLLRGWIEGWTGVAISLTGLVVCALVPVIMFRQGAMGGGDAKLFAALGALLGPFAGVEAQFFTLLVAALFACAQLTFHGQLWRTVRNAATFGWAALRPGRTGAADPGLLAQRIRLGPSVLVGVAIAVSDYGPWLWGTHGG